MVSGLPSLLIIHSERLNTLAIYLCLLHEHICDYNKGNLETGRPIIKKTGVLVNK